MERTDKQQIRMGSLLQEGLDGNLVMGHNSCCFPGDLPGSKGKTAALSQTTGSWGEKTTFHSFLRAKPAPELKYHVAPNQHRPKSPERRCRAAEQHRCIPTENGPSKSALLNINICINKSKYWDIPSRTAAFTTHHCPAHRSRELLSKPP